MDAGSTRAAANRLFPTSVFLIDLGGSFARLRQPLVSMDSIPRRFVSCAVVDDWFGIVFTDLATEQSLLHRVHLVRLGKMFVRNVGQFRQVTTNEYPLWVLIDDLLDR